jgi:serine/threonine protein kinase
MAALHPGPMLEPGYQLDEWRIDDVLGGGRDGVVYRAHERGSPRRIVAIKVYAADNPRLRREVEVIQSLNHPCIVAVYQARFDGPLPYLVMERIDGPTLGHWMSEGAMLPSQAETVFRDAVSALAYLHARGLQHRDVKPQNFVFDRVRGRLVLVDFGHVHGRNTLTITSPHVVFATIRYVPPECGTPAETATARDVYALGVMLFEMLTGERAFTYDAQANIIDQIQQVRTQQAVGPLDPGPPVPERVRGVVRAATAPQVRDRFPSARELWDALDVDCSGVTAPRAPPRLARRSNSNANAEPEPQTPHPWRDAFRRWLDV